MSGIESSIGKKTFTSTPRKVLNVPDDSGFEIPQEYLENKQNSGPPEMVKMSTEQFNELRSHRQENMNVTKRVTSETKARLEALVGIGRITSDITLGNFKFTLQSLKVREEMEARRGLGALNAVEQHYEILAQTLARALIKINDHPVDIVLGSSDLQDKINFIWELEDVVAMKLFNHYVEMIQDTKKKIISLDLNTELKKS